MDVLGCKKTTTMTLKASNDNNGKRHQMNLQKGAGGQKFH